MPQTFWPLVSILLSLFSGQAAQVFHPTNDVSTRALTLSELARLTSASPSISSAIPPHLSIDARTSSSKPAEIKVHSPVNWLNPTPISDFGLTTVAAHGLVEPPAVVSAISALAGDSPNVLTLTLSSPLPPQTRSTLRHYPSATDVCFGALPGDVNQSGKTNTADLTALMNCLNQPTTCAIYQSDVNRSGTTNVQDVTTLINLLNGAGQPFSWLNRQLPTTCPPAAPADLDNTDFIQTTLDDCAAQGEATCRLDPGTYRVRANGVKIPSNLVVDLRSVVIQTLPSNMEGGPDLDEQPRYAPFSCDGCENVTILGGLIRGEQRPVPAAQWSEYRALLEIIGGTNVTIDGTKFERTEGDAITVLPTRLPGRLPSTNITIKNIETNYCGRQGISVISGRNIVITDSLFRNTAGKSPQSGIDIEPGGPMDWATVRMERLRCEDNRGVCIEAVLAVLNAGSPAVDIVAKDITINRGTFGLSVSYDEIKPALGSVTGRVLFQNVVINDVITGFKAGGHEPQAWDTRSRVAVTLDNVRINRPTYAVFEFNFKGGIVVKPIRILPSTTWVFDGPPSSAIYYHSNQRAGVSWQ